MKNKKIIAVILVASIMLLSACADKKENKSKEDKKEDDKIEETEEETTKDEKSYAGSEVDPDEVTESSEEVTEETEEECEEHQITFSGVPEEISTIMCDCYYEGDDYVIFFKEGCVVPGDTVVNIDLILDELEELYGMPFDTNPDAQEDDWRRVYFTGGFENVNADMSKSTIIVLPDPHDETIEWTFYNEMMVYDSDLFKDGDTFSTLVHELTHLYRLKRGECLGSVMEEGIALYAEDMIMRDLGLPAWNAIQYISYDNYLVEYDTTDLYNDPEAAFIEATDSPRSAEQIDYQYGKRFIVFLMEEYGPDVIATITENSVDYNIGKRSDENDAIVIELIKASTSDDVFERFVQWLPNGYYEFCGEYVEYMHQFGL